MCTIQQVPLIRGFASCGFGDLQSQNITRRLWAVAMDARTAPGRPSRPGIRPWSSAHAVDRAPIHHSGVTMASVTIRFLPHFSQTEPIHIWLGLHLSISCTGAIIYLFFKFQIAFTHCWYLGRPPTFVYSRSTRGLAGTARDLVTRGRFLILRDVLCR